MKLNKEQRQKQASEIHEFKTKNPGISYKTIGAKFGVSEATAIRRFHAHDKLFNRMKNKKKKPAAPLRTITVYYKGSGNPLVRFEALVNPALEGFARDRHIDKVVMDNLEWTEE